MKKTSTIATLLICSALLLSACGKSESNSSTATSSSQKTSQTSKSSSKQSPSETSGIEGTVTENSTDTQETSASDTTTHTSQTSDQTTSQASTGIDVNVVAAGDFSAIAGAWTNDLGDSVTISSDGSVTATSLSGTYQISSNGVSGDAFFGTVYDPNDAVGSANITVIPANSANPRTGGINGQNTITMGQDASADEHPYYRN